MCFWKFLHVMVSGMRFIFYFINSCDIACNACQFWQFAISYQIDVGAFENGYEFQRRTTAEIKYGHWIYRPI